MCCCDAGVHGELMMPRMRILCVLTCWPSAIVVMVVLSLCCCVVNVVVMVVCYVLRPCKCFVEMLL